MNPVWKLNFFLFNIVGYGEFFSGITPFRQKTRNLILMVPHSNWLWTVTTDPVWHFPHQNVYKIHQGVMLQLQYEYYAIFWKIFPMHMHRGYWNIILYLFMTLQLLRLVDLMCFCSKRADDVEKDC